MSAAMCSVEGCETPAKTKGWCNPHYQAAHRYGDPLARRPQLPLKDRLLANIIEVDGCWEWQGTRDKDGYGTTSTRNRSTRAHRASYETFVGPIPEGLQIDHLCRNTRCINPAHLEPVTARENVRRSSSPPARNAAKTHCDKGHPFDEENTYVSQAEPTKRRCRICRHDAVRRWRAAS